MPWCQVQLDQGRRGRGEQREESKKQMISTVYCIRCNTAMIQAQMIPEELRPHSGMTTMATRQGSSSRKGRLVMKLVML